MQYNLNPVLETLPKIKKAVTLLSGGLDSTTLAYLITFKYGAENVYALSFNYGQKQSLELQRAAKTCEKLGITHRVLDIKFLGDIVAPVSANITGSNIAMPTIKDVLGEPQPPTYVPYRNLILLSMALAYAESNDCQGVFGGYQAIDTYSYWDVSMSFVDAVNNVSILNRKHDIRVYSPFCTWNKAEEIQLGLALNVDYSNTLTCYNPDEHGVSCGRCPSCSERIQHFMELGLKDPVPYAIDIPW